MILSPCIEWIFAEHEDICDRVHAAKAAGLSAVEFHLWRAKPIERLATTLQETGMRLTSFCVEPRRSLIDPAEHEEFLTAIDESLVVAQALGCPPMIVASGFTRPDVTRTEQCRIAAEVLREAARRAALVGVSILLEPVNSRIELRGMFLDNTPEGLAIVEAAGSPNLGLLYDLYHSTVMDEDMANVLDGRMELVKHVHFADVPGRHEPGTGTIDWRRTLETLDRLGYDGVIGLEYLPTLPSGQSIALVRQTLGL